MTSFSLIVETSERISTRSARTEKVRELANCIRAMAEDEIEIGVLYLSGELPQGKVGIGFSQLRDAAMTRPANSKSLLIRQVDAALTEITMIKGTGSAAKRADRLAQLFGHATESEQHFLFKLIAGELRQGALAGVMVDAIAFAADLPTTEIRRAAMYAENLGKVARAAMHEERTALTRFQLATLMPIAPMLAEPAADMSEALELLGGEAALEWKIDGARIQVHKQGEVIKIFTRSLNDITSSVPEVVEAVRAFAARELVLDGEVIALDPTGRPLPFQVTMRRFGRKLDIDSLRKDLPLQPFFFDCLKLDEEVLADRPTHDRHAALARIVPESMRIPRLVARDATVADVFYNEALDAGHEGVMAKSLTAPYEAGKRGASWLKIKRTHTLDLVVLAAEWGSGRRTGKLSNLHLGALDPITGQFVMLGKTFKGLTDALLEWQTAEFLKRETRRDAMTVHVRPELVVEIAFNDIQASSQYPGGYALRFARVKRYRPDKSAQSADTIDTIRKLFKAQSGVEMR